MSILLKLDTFRILTGVNDPTTIKKRGPPTFGRFLNFVTKGGRPKGKYQYDEHWRPVYGLCDPCNINYDYVLKMEALNAESQWLLEDLKLADKVQIPHILSTSSESRQRDVEYYRELLRDVSAATLQRVLDIFQLDFHIFDYDISPFYKILEEKNWFNLAAGRSWVLKSSAYSIRFCWYIEVEDNRMSSNAWNNIFTCSPSAGQQLMRIVVLLVLIGTKLNFLLSAVDILIFVFIVGLIKEILSITIDTLMGHGLLLQFGPINFPCMSLMGIPSCLVTTSHTHGASLPEIKKQPILIFTQRSGQYDFHHRNLRYKRLAELIPLKHIFRPHNLGPDRGLDGGTSPKLRA